MRRRLESAIDEVIALHELGQLEKQLVELEAERGHRRLTDEEWAEATCLRQRRQRLEQRLEKIEANNRKGKQS
jgi:hypothetical protein